MGFQVHKSIEDKLTRAFVPAVLDITNERPMHNVPAGSETHFKVVVVSAAFSGKSLVERHRLVYQALGDELRAGLHALSITSRTPEEWQAHAGVAASPPCLGGSKQ